MYSTSSVAPGALSAVATEQQLTVTSGAPLVGGSPQKVAVWGHVNLLSGAAAITATLKVHRGNGLGGAVLYTSGAVNVPLATTASIPFGFDDTAPDGTGVYTLSITQSVAQALTVNDATIRSSGINSLQVAP